MHGTYNAGDDTLVFLAILSPAVFEGPALIDVSTEEPWASLRPARTLTRDAEPMPTVLLIGTLDTKGEEYAYVRDRLRQRGGVDGW